MEKALVRIRQEQVGEHTEAVNARELHDFLGSRQQFANWIRNRIEQYGFVEGQDYVSFNNSIKRGTGATWHIEYLISLDMAKELAMLERTEKGRQARRYFIECEKKLRQLSADLAEMERLDGARAMAALLSAANRAGRTLAWLERLAGYRRMGLSQREVAKLLDVERTTVQRYEKKMIECGCNLSPDQPVNRKMFLEVLS